MNVFLHREQMNSSSIVCVLSCLFKRIYIFNLISYECRWMAFFICLGPLMCFQTWGLCKFLLTLNAAKWLYICECFPMILQYIWPPKFLSHWKELNGFWPVWILTFLFKSYDKSKISCHTKSNCMVFLLCGFLSLILTVSCLWISCHTNCINCLSSVCALSWLPFQNIVCQSHNVRFFIFIFLLFFQFF